MKIKNMKLMLLGLLAMGSMNAFAVTDEAARSVNGVVYELVTNADKSKTATVLGINSSATDAQMATIAIPAEVAGEYGTYKVTAITAGWEKAAGYKDVTAKTKTLSIDVTNLTAALADNAFSSFTKLESLTITDSNAADKAKTKEFKGGFSADAKKTIKTVDFSGSNISKIGANAFEDCIALTGFNLAKVTEVGEAAFKGCYSFTELSIPATVTKIGDNAFANMYYKKDEKTAAVGLQTLTFDAFADAAKGGFTAIPDAFAGDKLLKTVSITSAIATSFAGNFKEAEELATLTLNMPKLNTISGVFGASKFATVNIENTGLKTLEDLDLSKAHQTLATIKLPKALETLEGGKFADCVALTAIDLSNTKVTVIPTRAFEITGNEKAKPTDKNGIAPKLASVKLNAKTTEIGEAAFQGQSALATIEGLNQGELTTIGEAAFNKAGLTAVDLSSASKLKTIPAKAFANMATLTSIKLNKAIEEIETGAFANDANVASINLGDLEKLTELNPIFHEGVVGVDADAKEVAIALTSLTLPSKLKVIAQGALQLLDIEEITIPATVTEMGDRALQGCIYLKTFTWNDCQEDGLAEKTFLGTDKLEDVYFMGGEVEVWLRDYLFFGNDKDVLTVHVTAEAYNYLIAECNWNQNSKYSTLEGVAETDLKFEAHNADGYWKTYLIPSDGDAPGTWIKAGGAVKVYGAVIEGANVVLKEAGVENGYYKIWPGQAVVLNSQEETIKIEIKNLGYNKWKSTVGENQLRYAVEDITASRLKYMYKLGVKDEQIKFWRVTSGTIKKFVPYLIANDSRDPIYDREFLDYVFEDNATAIKGIQTKADKDAPIYNLQGVRVKTAQKGIYIQNGKKFIVK